MVFATWQVGQLLWSMLWFSLFFLLIWTVVAVFMDIFRSHDLSGWSKALWTLLIVFLPWFGVFVYLIARGNTMADRRFDESYAAQQPMGSTMPPSPSSTDDLSTLVDLRDRGVIDDIEFQTMKQKIVAS